MDLEEIAKAALAKLTETEQFTADRDNKFAPVLVVPNGRAVKGLAEFVTQWEKTQASPYRRRGTYRAANVASLLAWMEAHCREDAPVFGEGSENIASEWRTPKLALIGIGNYSSGEEAQWHDFNARYDFPVTAAWTAWCKTSGEFMKHAEFAEFVESHIHEFDEPRRGEELGEAVTLMIEALGGTKTVATPSKIYDMARGIKITVSEKVEVALDRSSGEAALKFTEEHTGAGGRPVAIPKFFYIRIPIFFGEEPSLVGALLRYRNAGGGQVLWSYELFAPDMIVKEAFDRACGIVKRANRTLYLGTPDAPQ